MLKLNILGLSLILCFTLLAGCSPQQSPSASSSNSSTSSSDTSKPQEMTTDELHQYFQQAFDAKGNALDTPEQLALELSEIQALVVDTALLPADYEVQYKTWRTAQVENIVTTLQAEYEQIISELPLFDGTNTGAVFADVVTLEETGKPNLVVVSALRDESYVDFDLTVYGEANGHAEQYPVELGGGSPGFEGSLVSLVQRDGKTLIRTQKVDGRNVYGDIYEVAGGKVQAVDSIYDESTESDQYLAFLAPYAEERKIFSTFSTSYTIHDRGILPDLPPDTQRKIALLDVLNSGGIQYARLADMDGDGTEDLLTVVNGEYLPIFRIYLWNGTEIQTADLDQEIDEIRGVYQEKGTEKIYVCYEGGAGPYSWCYYERIGETIKISEEELSWEEYTAQRNKFELIDDLMYDLPKYDTVEAVRQQLITE